MRRIKKVLLAALTIVIAHGYGTCSVATAANVGGSGVSGLRTHDHSSAGQGGPLGAFTVTGTVTSTKACASGFTRRGPNYCQRTTTTSVVAWTDATACTARTTGMSLPADAKVVLLELRFQALAGNAVGSRTNFVTFYNNSGCTGNVTSATATHTTHEQAAVAAGTVLSQRDHFVMAPLVATDTFYTIQGNAGGNGNADVLNHYVQGYFD